MDLQVVIWILLVWTTQHAKAFKPSCTKLGFTCRSECKVSSTSGQRYCWLRGFTGNGKLRRGYDWDYCSKRCKPKNDSLFAVNGQRCKLPVVYKGIRYNACITDYALFGNKPFCAVGRVGNTGVYRRCSTQRGNSSLDTQVPNITTTEGPPLRGEHEDQRQKEGLPLHSNSIISFPEPTRRSSTDQEKASGWIAILAGACGGGLAVIMFLACCMFCKRRNAKDNPESSSSRPHETDGTVDFTYMSGRDYESQHSAYDQSSVSNVYLGTMELPEIKRNPLYQHTSQELPETKKNPLYQRTSLEGPFRKRTSLDGLEIRRNVLYQHTSSELPETKRNPLYHRTSLDRADGHQFFKRSSLNVPEQRLSHLRQHGASIERDEAKKRDHQRTSLEIPGTKWNQLLHQHELLENADKEYSPHQPQPANFQVPVIQINSSRQHASLERRQGHINHLQRKHAASVELPETRRNILYEQSDPFIISRKTSQ